MTLGLKRVGIYILYVRHTCTKGRGTELLITDFYNHYLGPYIIFVDIPFSRDVCTCMKVCTQSS